LRDKPRQPPLTWRVARGTARVLARHGDDIGGLLLMGLGAVAGLGIYAQAGGRAGLALADACASVFGVQRVVVPVALLLTGFALVWWLDAPAKRRARATTTDGDTHHMTTRRKRRLDEMTADDEGDQGTGAATGRTAARRPPEQDDDKPSTASHVAVGCVLLSAAVAGLLHVHRGLPARSGPVEDIRDAGGWYGIAVGDPLHDLLSSVGATLVLAALAICGLVVLTSTPIRVAADRTVAGVRPVIAVVANRVGRLFGVPGAEKAVEVTLPPYVADVVPDGVGEDDTVEGEIDPADLMEAAKARDQAEQARQKRRRRRGAADADAEAEAGAGAPSESEQLAIDLGPAAKASPWKLPAVTLLDRSGSQQVDKRAVEDTGRTLERALAEHGVETRLVGMVVGPTVSRYELELAPGVKVNRVTSLHKDIAYAMATPDVRILAPIPGKQAIGIEVPNVRRQIVALGDILVSEEARRATHPLDVAVGRDINGRSVMMNLASMPHLLIAGATGAGKSSCLNSLLTSILIRSTPDQVRMILVDPKRVEMGQYDRLPHLLTQVVTNPKKAANALAWAVKEMERRYDLLAEVGFRDVNGYNAAVSKGDLASETDSAGEVVREFARLPYVLVVIDELADLMMVAARDVEESICRLAQMARAVGIHLVIATQRPSVNVITGLIKANVPARLAFAVSSVTDSRVILDQAGAERLIGKGDMLLLEGGSSVPRRLQGAWVTEDEVRKVAAVWKRQAPDVNFDDDVQGSDDAAGEGRAGGGGDDDDDLLDQAMELVVRSQLGSTSMLQRKLRVGFARAGRLMDLLEQRGVVGPSEGSKARAVLMTVAELEETLDSEA
jgi:DNA segregation ATPase FtsK/SpoIIIE, S-DNA-T family